MTSNPNSGHLQIIVVCGMRLAPDDFAVAFHADVPGTWEVRYDVIRLPSGPGLRRTVLRGRCVVDRCELDVADTCLTCALRADAAMTLDTLSQAGPRPVLLLLPAGAEVPAVVDALDGAVDIEPRADPYQVHLVIAAVDTDALVDDLMGDDLLVDRRLHWADHDRRSVGEVLARSLDYADLVAARGNGADEAPALGLLRHLAGDRVARLECFGQLSGLGLIAAGRDPTAASRRLDPRHVTPPVADDCDQAWTLDLHSWKPLHPGRLHQRLADLATGSLRGRGRFWLPTRADTVCLWDCAGAQLSVGAAGQWEGQQPSTRLVITGLDATDRTRIVDAFEDALMSDRELVRGLTSWIGYDDGFDAWLGAAQPAG